ncbi:vWA domain-containing protein [Angustibacter sp. McL0619]|uniref:vWA domain-containing protein n=1 Tax=Angustibacter sp. McL0619 TaxID=3415676 RepID=UPI003CEB7593
MDVAGRGVEAGVEMRVEADVAMVLAGFARTLRAAGVPVTPDRTAAFLTAAAEVGAGDRAGVYWAGRATLCADPDHLRLYDLAFDDWFGGRQPRARGPEQPPTLPPTTMAALESEAGSGVPEDEQDPLRAAASSSEVLRHRDVADLDDVARTQMRQLLAELDVRLPSRRSSRRRPSGRGELDVRRTLREELRRGGEPGPLRYRRAARRPRRVVWLVDVSGSMAPYADVLLRLAHAQVRAGVGQGRSRVEVFTIGTRLTRVTPAFAHRDVELALRAAGEQVPDWSGGTRLGETLAAFNERWGRRGVARGAVVVVCSDGWERGDPVLLGEQVHQLHRLAHRLVWVNPHRGKEGYQPVQGGMAAVLPYVDDFVAGHSVASYARLMEVVARA